MSKYLGFYFYSAFILSGVLISTVTFAIDVDATAKALRMSNTITGGMLPTSDPIFAQMVSKIQAQDLAGAAALAANSSFFGKYLARRLALQMQNPALDASVSIDSDASSFIIAHFIGAGTIKPSISTIWSENATYLVNLTVAGVTTATHTASLTAAQLAAVDWTTALVKVPGQNAKNLATAAVAIPAKHVGGYVTLSDRIADTSLAMYGYSAGTNLRMIESIWQIATGFSLLDVQSSQAGAYVVPRFVPEYDPNFFHGQGQAACISCHGGGMSSLNHGYAAVADKFDFDPVNGFIYIETPTVATMKSLGSDPAKRTVNSTCNLVANPTAVCNPDSAGIDANQAWDVGATWGDSGVLATMGWTGPTTGQGLNELGLAIGKAKIVYENLVRRVVGEICPMGTFSPDDVHKIAAAADPFAGPPGTDDIRTIVSLVASNGSCQ